MRLHVCPLEVRNMNRLSDRTRYERKV